MAEDDLTEKEEELADQISKWLEDGGTPLSGANEQMRILEQCLLASSLEEIVANHENYQRPWRYSTTFSTDDAFSSTADFLNRVHSRENIDFTNCNNSFLSTPCVDKTFANLSTFERSKILWNFKLSKMLYDPQVDINTGKVDSYSFKKEIPLVFEQMAYEDISDHKAGSSAGSPQYGAATLSGMSSGQGYFGRPQVGYGFKSFDWTYSGANPETVRNDIEAKLVLEFQNFDQLNKVREYVDEEGDIYLYSILDLLGYGPSSPKVSTDAVAFAAATGISIAPAATAAAALAAAGAAFRPGYGVTGGPDAYHPSLVEIKAVVGWDCWDKDYDLKEKLKGQKTTLFLTLINHDFNISQLGTFTLTLSYRARLEGALSNLRANVVFPAESDEFNTVRMLDKAIVVSTETCNESAIKKYKDARDKELRKAWKEGFAEMYAQEFAGTALVDSPRDAQSTKADSQMTSAYDEKMPRIWKATYDKLRLDAETNLPATSNDSPPVITQMSVSELTAQAATNPDINSAEPEKNPENFTDKLFKFGGESHDAYFVYLGELLEVMAHRALSKNHFMADGDKMGAFGNASKIKLILGPARLKRPDGTTITCSLGDIPISLEAFNNFWYRNVIQNEREVYNFMEFVRDLGDQLLDGALGNDCAFGAGAFSGRTELKTGFVSIPEKTDNTDPLFDLDQSAYGFNGDILVENISKLAKLVDQDLLESTPPDKVWNYIVLYLDNMHDMTNFNGNELEDMERGIYHLKIHQGILQSIDFEKTDQPYLKEARFERLNENPLVYLSNVYKIRASMVGNMFFYPGQMVYIDPIGFGSSLGSPMEKSSMSNVMGLGGYHIITSVSHKISRDFTTEIVGLWDNNGHSRPRNDYSLPDSCGEEAPAEGIDD